MTDILEKLMAKKHNLETKTKYPGTQYQVKYSVYRCEMVNPDGLEAHDEIVRLRGENEELRENGLEAHDEIIRLRIENEELRESLKECADDLEAEVNDRYRGALRQAMPHRYERDMAPALKARILLDGAEEEQ